MFVLRPLTSVFQPPVVEDVLHTSRRIMFQRMRMESRRFIGDDDRIAGLRGDEAYE